MPGMTVVWISLAVLLSQVGEFIFRAERMGGQIKAVALLILIFVALRYRLPSSFDGSVDERQTMPAVS